jgi:hypothetical protein
MNTYTTIEKQIIALNESFINFFKGTSSSVGNPYSKASSSSVCQICKSSDHIATMCPYIGNMKLKCAKCGLPHKMENCRVKCGYCYGMRHIENKCWKQGKDGKTTSTSNNYLEVLVNDEEATLEQLNMLCGTKYDIFSRARIPTRRLPVEIPNVEITNEGETKCINFAMNPIVDSKILHHFIKGKIYLFLMETTLIVLGELEDCMP